MTEEQIQSVNFSRRISITSDDSFGSTSSLKLFIADAINSSRCYSSRCSKTLVVIAMLVIISIISATIAIFHSNSKAKLVVPIPPMPQPKHNI